MVRGRRLVVAGLSSIALGLVMASCGLGLDESKIGAVAVDPSNEASVTDGPPGFDAGDGNVTPTLGGPCAKDDDCKTTNACFKGRCDLTRKACVFDVCKPQACSTATCDQNAKTCGPGKVHPFKAAQFAIASGPGCGGAPSRCFAAVWPYLFVGTSTGVVAYAASDPAADKPAEVPITGLDFLPNQILASGSRVYFIGQQGGSATAARLPLAFVDVPADPFARSLAAKTVLAGYNRPAGEAVGLLYRANDTAFLLDSTTPSAVAITPPLAEPVSLTPLPFTVTPGDGIAAVSGDRVAIMNINPANSIASFGLVSGIGSPMPSTAADQPLSAASFVSGPQTFASGPDGAVLWTISSITGAVAVTPGVVVRAIKSYFLVADSTAITFDQANGVDLEVYAPVANPGVGSGLVGPATMLDAKTAMVTAATPQNLAQTSVQFISKAPLGIMKNADMTPRRFVLPTAPGALGAANSNGIGYILSVDTATTMSVYVFDPACGSQ